MPELTLKRLQDRIEIEALLYEYCRALDVMDLDALSRTFTEDCLVEYGESEPLKSRGRAALKTGLQRMWRFKRTSHHLSNVQMDFVGDSHANSLCYVIAWHEYPDLSTTTIMGQYRDEHALTKDGWRIARRKLMLSGSGPEYTVPLYRLERRPPPPGWVNPIA